jgi:peptidoglycan/xylan/chitin deacetylase (PgdA/CDA1 family)
MIVNRAYYLIKPLLPWSVRIFLRRRRAISRRAAFADSWPIDERAGATPPNWRGWPEGKQFALVLTHDVEGAKGLQRVQQLMEVERRHGFRSSFNFVPKGEYHLSEELRRTLESDGFEVGVHGLEHDGKLYASETRFAEKASRVREYLRDWNASGFRSPFMQHRLTWVHQLGVEYDASTFDTDPFEPEPDGVGTIFPFWVSGPAGTGYVELPYTLAQDFTLFVVLREPSIDIWKMKLDWVAAHGGMALLNVHPDYICFQGKPARDEYPISHYEDFLKYLKARYQSQYCSALPRDLAAFYRSSILSLKSA